MNQTLYRTKLREMLWLTFGLSAIFVIMAKIYTVTCSDILIMYTAWPEVIEILINILECGIYGISYAILIYAAYRFQGENIMRFAFIYGASVLFKYVANYVMTWLTDTGMSADYLLENLSYVLIYTAIELLQCALVLFVVLKSMKTYHKFIEQQVRIAQKFSDTSITPRTYVFPFTALFSWKNPLQKCALWSGVVISGFKVFSRLIYDINYGWPSSVVDALWMLISYLLDVFAGLAVCLLITYLLMQFDKKEQDKKAE